MTNLVAAFPMYNRPELGPAFDALWEATRAPLLAAGIAAPKALTLVEDNLLDFWQRPDLLLSQTCGYPYRHFLKDRVSLVATPDFGLQDCPPGHYRSAWVVRADDPRQALTDFDGTVLAFNGRDSQSGYAAPLLAAQRARVRFGEMRCSGTHSASARMVAEGAADIAGLDAVSWRHMTRLDPWTEGLRVLGWTEPTPGLPFITVFAPLADLLHASLRQALETLAPPGVDRTWWSSRAFSICDGQPTVENCGPCDGYSVRPSGRPPHPSALSHAGIGNVIH